MVHQTKWLQLEADDRNILFQKGKQRSVRRQHEGALGLLRKTWRSKEELQESVAG